MRRFAPVVTALLLAAGVEARADDVRDRVAASEPPCTRRLVRRCELGLLPRRYWYACYFRPRTTADRASLAAAAGLAAGSAVVLGAGDRDAIVTSSDVGQWLLPLSGLAVPLAHRDLRGALQAGLTIALTGGLTFLGKETIGKQRPPLRGGRSYPSGHTSAAFAGAAFLYERYGPRYGIPAYVVAIHTGVARVVANKHFLDDVIAGAGLGMLSAGLFEDLLCGRCRPAAAWCRHPTWRYEFGFGAFRQDENRVRAPATGGTEIDLARLNDWTEARASARLTVEWFPTPHDEVAFRVDPADIRTRAAAPAGFSFAGAAFPAGTPLAARWRGNEYRLRWRRDLLSCHRRLALRAGGSLVFVENGVTIESAASTAAVTSLRIAPCPHVALAYALLPRLQVSLLAEGVPGVSFFGFDLEAAVRFAITPRWDAGLAYRWWWRPLDDSRLADDASTQALFVTIGRSF